MTNRCDSVDALTYVYYEMMRMKETNYMLEKDKKCIEFSMHSMMATHKPYQEDTEIAITGMAPGKSLLLANNPFDIPCDVVVVSKRYFERLQASVASHEKQDEEYLNFLKALFPDEDVEKLAWMTRQICEPVVSHGAAKYWRDKCEQLDGFVELYEKVESQIKKWKEGTGCPSPSAAKNLIETYERDLIRKKQEIDKWQEETKCETPEAAATWITSYESACGRGNRLAESVEKLKEEVVSWKNVTGYSTPEDYMHARISGAFHTPFDYTAAWQKATGCDSPEKANKKLASYEGRLDSVKQSASYAIRHLDNIVFRDDKRTDWSDK